MKKILIFAMAIVTMFAFTACGASVNGGNSYVPTLFVPGETLSGEITVSAFDSMLTGMFLEEAARLFMHEHPDTVINIDTFSAMPEIRVAEGGGGGRAFMTAGGANPQERRDYINMINTELMSGSGPDILALDVLPFYQYARNGLLVNLLDLMEADSSFDISDYRENIFDALTTPDGLFVFPMEYMFEYVIFDNELFADEALAELRTENIFTHEQLIALGVAEFEAINSEADALIPMFPLQASSLFNSLFQLNYNQFVDINNRQANFIGGEFEEMLDRIIYLEREEFLTPRMDTAAMIAGGAGDMDMMAFRRMMNPDSVYTIRNSSQLLREFYVDDAVQGFAMTADGAGIGGAGIFSSDADEIAGLLGNSNGEAPFTIGNAFGINANSDNQALAWEFIKFLSTDAMRETFMVRGLPTHIETFEARTTQALTGGIFGGGGGFRMAIGGQGQTGTEAVTEMLETLQEQAAENQEMTPEQQSAFHEYTETVAAFTSMLNTFHTTNILIEEVVLSAVEEFFDGTSTAEDVAQSLQSRISLVLNE